MAEPIGAAPGRVTVEELAAARAGGTDLQVVDVREPWEVELCALDGALNIPLATLPGRLAEVARDRPVVVVCHHGARSQQAVNFMRAQGVPQPLNLTGGIDAWARRIDPTMKTY
jgi:rhodanese-related sulfurtransferase